MKIVVALDNVHIINKLKKDGYDIVNIKEFDKKEDVIGFLSEINIPVVIITKSDLRGDIGLIEYIDGIKAINEENRVILVIENLTKELKETLFSKEIFNIIEGKDIYYNELIDNINNPKMVIYRNERQNNPKAKIMFVMGVDCCGKTYVSKSLADCLAKKKDKKVLVMDLDCINPDLDQFIKSNNIYGFKSMINDICNKNINKHEIYFAQDSKYSNLNYLLNSQNIGIPSSNIIMSCVECYINEYDYIIIDTSTLMLKQFSEIADKLNAYKIMVLRPDIFNIRKYKELNIDFKNSNYIFILNRVNIIEVSDRKFLQELGIQNVQEIVKFNMLFKIYTNKVIKNNYFKPRLKKLIKFFR